MRIPFYLFVKANKSDLRFQLELAMFSNSFDTLVCWQAIFGISISKVKTNKFKKKLQTDALILNTLEFFHIKKQIRREDHLEIDFETQTGWFNFETSFRFFTLLNEKNCCCCSIWNGIYWKWHFSSFFRKFFCFSLNDSLNSDTKNSLSKLESESKSNYDCRSSRKIEIEFEIWSRLKIPKRDRKLMWIRSRQFRCIPNRYYLFIPHPPLSKWMKCLKMAWKTKIAR